MNTGHAKEKLRGWLNGRLPADWFEGPVELITDRDEITIIGTLSAPATDEGASDAEKAAAAAG